MRKGRDGKMEENGMENNGENSGPLTLLPVDRLTATDCNAATCAFFLTMGETYHKDCITSNKPSGSVDCVQIIFFYFLLGLNINFLFLIIHW